MDAAARDEIERAGKGDLFGHGTGHGVGLEVHEAPRVAPKVDTRLDAGNVVTIEPGVYVPGEFGVRIEDMVLVTTDGTDSFTALPHELITVRAAKYQHLEGVPMDWLRGACSALR